jgi:hypothetical protein
MWYKHAQLDDVTLATIHYKWEDFDIANDFDEEIWDEYLTERKWK